MDRGYRSPIGPTLVKGMDRGFPFWAAAISYHIHLYYILYVYVNYMILCIYMLYNMGLV